MSFPRYPNYKDSGVEWLGEVPDNWEVKPLGYLCSKIGSGKTPSGGAETYTSEGIVFLRSQNVYDEGLFLDDVVYITEKTDADLRASRVQAGDILLNITGASLGRTCLVPNGLPQANVNQHVCIIRLNDVASRDFVAHSMKSCSMRSQIDTAQSGAAREGLNFAQISKLLLALPAPSEQARIAAFLDRETGKIDELVAEQRRLMELLKEKRQAVISHAVTRGLNLAATFKPSGIEWLGDVPAHWAINRLRLLFRQEKRQDQIGKPVLSVYRDYGVIFKDSRDDNMNKTPEDLSAYQLVNPNDLVVNKMKAWQGSLGVSDVEGITSPDYVVFSPRHRECSAFLHLLLRSQRMVSIYRSISNGIRPSQWRLEPDSFLGLPAFLPPEQEQRDLVTFITDQTSRFDALTAEAQRAIDLLQERRTALISAAVTGQIDVCNSNS